jgi:hypothetical protein
MRFSSYEKRKRKSKLWQRIISIMVCAVVFCTAYALTQPTITRENCHRLGAQVPPELVDMSLTASIYTDGTYQTPAEDATVITVSGLLPSDAAIKAYPVEIDAGMNTLCAYDISIILPDGTVYEPTADESLDVHIYGGVADRIRDGMQVYHIPEEGEPEALDTIVTDNSIHFEVKHFSVYAVMASGTMDTVYLNGTSGSDSAAGTQNAPVKTFEHACELLAPNGTLYISGTVTDRHEAVEPE